MAKLFVAYADQSHAQWDVPDDYDVDFSAVHQGAYYEFLQSNGKRAEFLVDDSVRAVWVET